MKRVGILICTCVVASAVGPLPTSAKVVAGWVESARLVDIELELEVKLDSGAEHSSLHSDRIREFKRKGKRWVRFRLVGPDGDDVTLERPILRQATIRRHNGQFDHRPVIRVELCLGSVVREAEVNLVNRSGFDYLMLVGRSFLDGEFVIDPSLEHQLTLDCPQK